MPGAVHRLRSSSSSSGSSGGSRRAAGRRGSMVELRGHSRSSVVRGAVSTGHRHSSARARRDHGGGRETTERRRRAAARRPPPPPPPPPPQRGRPGETDGGPDRTSVGPGPAVCAAPCHNPCRPRVGTPARHGVCLSVGPSVCRLPVCLSICLSVCL